MESFYIKNCTTKSDINEHLPTLYNYSTECQTIFETGVRGVVSSWAFAWGLFNNNSDVKKLFVNDVTVCDIEALRVECARANIDLTFEWKNNLELEFGSTTYDMTFIDTWHVYGQLKRELTKFSKITDKYIVLHDTTVDGEFGETIRLYGPRAAIKQSKNSGIPVDEITKGLWPAVEEFLESNTEWKLVKRYTNNNGLTILGKSA